MDRHYLRYLRGVTAGSIAEALQTAQFLRPHEVLSAAVRQATTDLGLCPTAGDEAMAVLGLSRHVAIGRLRRTQLLQLAQTIERFCQRARSDETAVGVA